MKDLTEGNPAKLIFNFAVPMLIGNVFQQLYNMVDSIVVGQFVGKEALSAVGVSFPIIFLMIAMILGLSMGSGIILSQFFGAKDMVKVKKTIDTTSIFLFWASLAITALGLVLGGPILRLMGTPSDVLGDAKVYLNIIFAGMILMFGYNALSAILRALGDSKTPLYFLIIATIVNIILDLLFVIVFKWGVAGVAWATVIAQGVSFVLCIFYLNRSKVEVLHIDLRNMTFDWDIFKTSIRIGLPSAIQQTLVGAGMMALTGIVNFFGTNVIAGFSAASRLESFAIMPTMNLSMALSTFVGQNLGARKTERVKKGFLATLLMSGGLCVAISAVLILFRNQLIGIFSNDQAVISVGGEYLLIVAGFYVVFSSLFMTSGVLRGAGDTFFSMFVTLFALWVVRIPFSWFFAIQLKMGTTGIWWGVPIGWGVGFGIAFVYYLTGRWKMKVVTKGPYGTQESGPVQNREGSRVTGPAEIRTSDTETPRNLQAQGDPSPDP